MNLEKAKPVNEEVAELKELIKELHGSVHQLQSEVQQLRHERPVVEVRKGVQLSPTIVGQIGGMILAAPRPSALAVAAQGEASSPGDSTTERIECNPRKRTTCRH